ncbi:MAG TPA: SRPBCC domain-containing protein [Anaerovoracaceae bacterium]|nr:SRPBCC domain-containing protein [Anaerovoracaceae bacterium]HYE68342.1 SRPBCC domain-containing protein [Anaerovoracaceae bacterium]
MNKEIMNTESSHDLDGVFEHREGTFSILRFRRHFPVAQDRLWYAISDLKGTQLWLNPVDQLELKVGGAFFLRTYDENNPAAWTSGSVTEVQPLQVLEYTWNQGPYAGGPAMQSKVRYELEPESEGTALTITHVLYDTTGEKYVVTFLANWHFHLDVLTQVLNGKYQDFAEYKARQAEEAGLSDREFMIKQVIGLHGAYKEKVSLIKN